MNEPTNELMRITQLPIIEEQLRTLKEAIEAEVAEAMSLVCTDETVQTVKAKRAELNKKFAELEEQRKAVKSAVFEPYNRFEAIYKECVTEPFARADGDLKGKINDVETEIKSQCEQRLRDYFDELCAAENIDFLTFEQTGVKVDMASAKQKTPKKLMEQIKDFVANVRSAIDAIDKTDNAAELMAEYKKTLNLCAAIEAVNERHRRIEAERTAQEARREAEKRVETAVAKVEAVTPPVVAEPPIEAEKPLKCVFTVYGTREQLKKLKEFLIKEGIKYE